MPTSNKKIKLTCLIDDDPIFLFGTQKLMEISNFSEEYITFNNGEEALEAILEIKDVNDQLPDVILLDLNMPVMDGWQFLDELIKIPTKKEMIIYIVTSSIDSADVKRVSSYDGIKNYLVKPVTLDLLNQIIGEVNEHQS